MRVIDKDTGEYFDLNSTDELEGDLRRWDEDQCIHSTTESRSTVASNGGIHFRKQCQTCGELVGQAISRALIPNGCPPIDETLVARCRAERRQNYEDIFKSTCESKKIKAPNGGLNITFIWPLLNGVRSRQRYGRGLGVYARAVARHPQHRFIT
jgi:hypothetical protein